MNNNEILALIDYLNKEGLSLESVTRDVLETRNQDGHDWWEQALEEIGPYLPPNINIQQFIAILRNTRTGS